MPTIVRNDPILILSHSPLVDSGGGLPLYVGSNWTGRRAGTINREDNALALLSIQSDWHNRYVPFRIADVHYAFGKWNNSVTDNNSPTPEEIKKKVQEAYARAIGNRNMLRSRFGSGIDHLFRDVKLYGYEAGADFIETNLKVIVQEAVDTAECKEALLTIPAYGFGRSAVAGMISKLTELTALKVDANASTITLTWADTVPRML